jgi:hypothetical protein
MEALKREQRVIHAIVSERDRIHGDSLHRMYNWKIASLVIGVVIVITRFVVSVAESRREHAGGVEPPAAHSPLPGHKRSAER